MSKHHHEEPFERGLLHDLEVLHKVAERRRVLGWLAAAGLTPLFGCGSSGAGSDATSAGGTAGASASNSAGAAGETDANCTVIPEETGGPYPGDGSNGPNVLTASGIVRDDITSSFGSLSGTAEGVPLTIELKLVSASGGCQALAGYAVYLWHCDRDGHYSLYTATDQNYLRGVQETDASGTVTFKSIFPACYSGRWPHIHFEIFESLELATAAGSKVATSQLAMPKAQCDEVFATTGYEQSIANFAQSSLATDNVFSDGATTETPVVSGSPSAGYVASLTVGVPI